LLLTKQTDGAHVTLANVTCIAHTCLVSFLPGDAELFQEKFQTFDIYFNFLPMLD